MLKNALWYSKKSQVNSKKHFNQGILKFTNTGTKSKGNYQRQLMLIDSYGGEITKKFKKSKFENILLVNLGLDNKINIDQFFEELNKVPSK